MRLSGLHVLQDVIGRLLEIPMITSNRTQNAAQSGILLLRFVFLLSFFLLVVGCGGGGDSGQAAAPSPSFATVIANSEANRTTPLSSPPIYQLAEVVQAIKNANLTAPEKIYTVAAAAELSVAQIDALFALPAGTSAAYIARLALPQPKATAQIVGLQLIQLPVNLTQARQLAVGIGLNDKAKMYAFGQMENLSSFDLNQITGAPLGTFENFISGNNASPLSGANRVTAIDADNLPVVVKDIPGLMIKKGWPSASALMARWFSGVGRTHEIRRWGLGRR
jgi:hypothetical protein